MTNEDIRWLHVEPTSRCNASCPACPRNNRGIGLRPGLIEQDLSMDTFKTVLNQLPNLHGIQLCGNFGDPIIAANILDIIKLAKLHCKKIQIHTNGSIRSEKWWKNLANLLSDIEHDVWFGIDGIGSVHEIYRQGTSYKKIISNAIAFIDNGGYATWQFIPYKHNEHQITDCIKESQRLKFKNFKLANLHRNIITVKHYKTGAEFDLLPPTRTFSLLKVVGNSKKSNTVSLNNCMHLNMPSVYLSAKGILSRCCYLHEEIYDSVKSMITVDPDLTKLKCIESCG